jgi:hypothetical protein
MIKTIRCKVRVLKPLCEVYAAYQPVVGGIYDADYRKPNFNTSGQVNAPVCVIKIKDKFICLKSSEYEILKEGDDDV